MTRLILGVVMSMLAPGMTALGQADHAAGTVVIEHIDLERTSDRRIDDVFLTIWNGLDRDAVVTDVELSGYGAVDIVVAPNGGNEQMEMPAAEGEFAIPARSSVTMSEDTLYVRAARGSRPVGLTAVTLTFADGRRVTALAPATEGSAVAGPHAHDGV